MGKKNKGIARKIKEPEAEIEKLLTQREIDSGTKLDVRVQK